MDALEQENVLLRQELEEANARIGALRDSIRELMAEYDSPWPSEPRMRVPEAYPGTSTADGSRGEPKRSNMKKPPA